MITIAVIYGGKSSEYEVSLRSAKTVIRHLNSNQFRVIAVHITQDLHWIVQAPHENPIYFSTIPPQLSCDVILSMAHGSWGEDGSMQGLFTLWGLPYIGADVLGSALGMDKIIAKQIIASQNITNIVPYVHCTQTEWHTHGKSTMTAIGKLGYPVFVKPSNSGSSLGIQKITHPSNIPDAIQEAFQYNSHVLIEKSLPSIREIEIGVLGNFNEKEDPLVSVAGEIITQYEFYSYEAKYTQPDYTTLKIPANLSNTQYDKLQNIAIRIFKALHLKDMARIDFFYSENTKRFYFNEVNTLPGFTETSMYPKLWEASGKSMIALLTHLIELALQRRPRCF